MLKTEKLTKYYKDVRGIENIDLEIKDGSIMNKRNETIDVDNEEGLIIPGMTANVSIITSKKENIMTVPNAALKFTPNIDGSGPKYKEQGIWIMENKRPRRVNIVAGVSDDVNTEISSKELKGNETVIIGFAEDRKSKKGGKRPGMRMF